MSSPFPGMDPFLEGYLWPDVHQALANQIREQLNQRLAPNYVARLAVAVIEDETGEAEIGVMYPDVEIIEARTTPRTLREHAHAAPSILLPWPAPAVILVNLKFRQVTVEIQDVKNKELITSIEILSPVNKREPGLTQYREKRKRLYAGQVNLLEIDLLRRGQRVVVTNKFAAARYLIGLTRAGSERMELWPLSLPERLPVLPVPLRKLDQDIPLDLQAALDTVYAQALYERSIDYTEEPPPPALSPQEKEWVRELLKQRVPYD